MARRPPEAQLARLYTDRALRLIRIGNGQSAWIRQQLRALARELRQMLTSADVSSLGRRALRALLADIEAAVAGRYADIANQQLAAAAELVAIEAAWAQRVSGFRRPAGASTLERLSAGLAVMGTPLRDAWRANAEELARRIAAAVRDAAMGGAPLDALLAKVLGTAPRGRVRGGLIHAAERNADALAQTTVSEASQDALRATWNANGVNAFRWHAVLDERTTAGCALRHGLVYDLHTLEPINHDIPLERRPPRHYRCRSILLPMAYAQDIPVPEDGGKGTFREYFDSLTPEEQDRLFGEGRADLFRRGVITQSDLVNQAGQMLTLAELRDLS